MASKFNMYRWYTILLSIFTGASIVAWNFEMASFFILLAIYLKIPHREVGK